MGMEIGDDDVLGALEIGDLEFLDSLADVGARRRRRARRGGYGRGRGVPARRLLPTTPGVPTRGVGQTPLGLPNILFTATSGATLPSQTQPQRPFLPKRLIVSVFRTGATSTGAVTITRLDIGADSMLVGGNAVPVEMFAATGVDLNMQLKPSALGNIILAQANLGTPALTMTDTVLLTIGFMGEVLF